MTNAEEAEMRGEIYALKILLINRLGFIARHHRRYPARICRPSKTKPLKASPDQGMAR